MRCLYKSLLPIAVLGRAEAFAGRQPVGVAVLDALGTAVGFAIALLILGGVRERLWHVIARNGLTVRPRRKRLIDRFNEYRAPAVGLFPPGAFLLAGLLFALVQGLAKFLAPRPVSQRSCKDH